MSGTGSQANNKKLQLDQLRFKRQAKANRSELASTAAKPANSSQKNGYQQQPAQSRDATVPSRFFQPPTTPNFGKVLVPNSSPETGPEQNNHYRGASSSSATPALSAQSSIYRPTWAPFGGNDPLSSSTAFTSSSSKGNASLRRHRQEDALTILDDDEPPRKKPNLGSSGREAREDITNTPSPKIQRGVSRRRATSGSMEISDEEEEVPAIVASPPSGAGPSRPRLVRERPIVASPAPSIASTPSMDRGYQIFKMEYPTDPENRVRAAWTVAGGDRSKAVAFMSDPSWAPPKPNSPEVERDKELGRVKELDDANKQQRAAVREKGKKSMIYANRPILDTNTATPLVSKVATAEVAVASPASPATPFAPPVNRKRRAPKMVFQSESEHEASESEEERETKKSRVETSYEGRALQYFNNRDIAALIELTGCTAEQAAVIIEKRPYESQEDFNQKLGQGKKKAGPAGISPRIFDDVVSIFEGYGSVDSILQDCEKIGESLRSAIASWTVNDNKATLPSGEVEDGSLALRSPLALGDRKPKNYISKQPSLIQEPYKLKDYQLLGINWLNLLYRRKYSCILADEMGLGKTIQVISFLAHLKEQNNRGPHLIIVPSSTLENWCREFARFAPNIKVQTYYASKEERTYLRQNLIDTVYSKRRPEGWEVLITTYALAQSTDSHDRKFFKKVEWDCSVYDEGHQLKNYTSQRYQTLLKYESRWRLLLTGTPLQNNLQELVSLMNFILPDQFTGEFTHLQAIFKAKGDANVSLLSQERISRAKKMMTPFVLRRRKDHVLKDLPNKTERIEWCDMTQLQMSIYSDALQRSRKTILDATADTPDTGTPASGGGGSKPIAKKKPKVKDKQYVENSSNVLMDLRKASNHPMMFRRLFTDDNLNGITKQLLKEPDFKKRGALFDIVKEDMTVMTDAELQLFCRTYKSTRKFLKDEDVYLDSGKVKTLLKLIARYREEGRKILIFSQFTMVLDILQVVFNQHNIKFLVLTGSTPVDVRQTLVDEFTDDETIPVFLLSTKAGGMGINLTVASVVIMFDQDFNPHNDKQAQDRAYRIGQKRDVDVVKLISRGTIEEDILKLGSTKLALDEAVAGDADGKESAVEKEVKTSLMKVLRRQLERDEEDCKDSSGKSSKT
ncbi:hypothetical protein FA15DRAFT_703471 [Coprinopsis marcescibilis]|uniref:DNA helicase n=1 Tax=Coprinopsis marcescibilis TaxID=230819 RepID=A0A5C3KZG0_COPMA|nr:hypothetical protein FA15DRAFT_703471 [Coprinopsis marcescibilis]